MKACSNCGRSLSYASRICKYCGAHQKISPAEKAQKSTTIWWITLAVIVSIFGVILVPIIAPDLRNDKPGNILTLGGFIFTIGCIAWLIWWFGRVRFLGKAECCLYFPFIGLLVMIYGLISLLFR
jgi:hypothetical protein